MTDLPRVLKAGAEHQQRIATAAAAETASTTATASERQCGGHILLERPLQCGADAFAFIGRRQQRTDLGLEHAHAQQRPQTRAHLLQTGVGEPEDGGKGGRSLAPRWEG